MQDYAARIAEIHQSLGIPRDYAATRQLPLIGEASGNELSEVERAATNALSGNANADKFPGERRSGDQALPRGPTVLLLAPAAAAWNRLAATARGETITPLPLSGFRSVARQTEIIRAKLSAGKSIEEILRVNAAPGYSEHHSGRAIDVGTPGEPPLTEAFANNPAFAWLVRRGSEFGFHLSYPYGNRHGIQYEPWHWCWRAR